MGKILNEHHTMRVYFIPTTTLNPYHTYLSKSMEPYGVEVESFNKFPSIRQLLKNRGIKVILHLHWPERLYERRWIFLPFSLSYLVLKLFISKILGYKIIWTAHNIFPHNQRIIFDNIERFFIVALSNAIITHCKFAKNEVERCFHRNKNVYSIPIGNYQLETPRKITKKEARIALGINQNSFVYLFFGFIKPYKGVSNLIETFKQISDENSILLVVGDCRSESLKNELIKLKGGDDRIKLVIHTIPDSEIPIYLCSAEVFVAPFTRITTSSSILLGLESGLPVIAPALGCLPELLTSECSILYNSTETEGLFEALRNIRNSNLTSMSKEAKRIANILSWDITGEQTYQVYKLISSN